MVKTTPINSDGLESLFINIQYNPPQDLTGFIIEEAIIIDHRRGCICLKLKKNSIDIKKENKKSRNIILK
jgi:hypothetical protein